ncbi:MAG: efflux transporter outer membrane subunit [Burkholderiaceae bacterium]
MRWYGCIFVIGTSFLAACAGVRKDLPSEATIPVPTEWNTATSTRTDPVQADWWKTFDDSTLDALIEEGLSHNDDIALAATRVQEARAQFRYTEALRLPNIQGSLAGARDRDVNPGFGVPEEQTAGEGVIEAAFDVDLFGRLKASSEAARSALLATRDAQQTVRLSVVASVASGYFTLLALDARLAIVRQTLRVRGDELHLEERRFAKGYSSALDLTRAQAEFASTEQLIPALELAIASTENGLSILLGRAPGTITRGGAFDRLSLPDVPVSLPSTLLRSRPDIAAAEARLAATDHNLDAARAAFLPDIQLGVTGGVVGSTLVNSSPVGVWSVGGSVLAPLFDAGRLKAQEHAATAQRDEAAFAYRKTALQAFLEVENELAAVARDREQYDALKRERDALARTFHLATRRYREGYSSYLDQLDAQRNLLSSELALVQSRLDRFNAAVSLFQALGGGWSPQEDNRVTEARRND